MKNKSIIRKTRRRKRIRGKIHGTSVLPRLSVHRTNKGIYAQLVDDDMGKTLVSVSVKHVKVADKQQKIVTAQEVGKLLGQKAKEKKIKSVVFDRGSFAFAGRVAAFAKGAREAGLQF